jgi:hypothetical protein
MKFPKLMKCHENNHETDLIANHISKNKIYIILNSYEEFQTAYFHVLTNIGTVEGKYQERFEEID